MSSSTHSKLIVIEGPVKNQEYELLKPEIVIGRAEPADILIDNMAVSRRHARITCENDNYSLEDLGSSNGTLLNGQPVKGRVGLKHGDQISLGQHILLSFVNPAEIYTRLEQPVAPTEVPHIVLEKEPAPETAIRTEFPSLVISVSGSSPITHSLEKGIMTIGRSEDNDIIIPSQIVSRHHARLERSGDDLQLVALPDVTNPLLVNGQPVAGRISLHNGDQIQVQSNLADLTVSMTVQFPGESPEILTRVAPVQQQPLVQTVAIESASPGQTLIDAGVPFPSVPPQFIVTVVGQPPQTYILDRDRMTLGRAEDNDIVIPSLIVSRHHATLERSAGGYELVISPGATNTLSCQGRPVTDRRILRHGDVLRIDSEIPGMMVSMAYQSPAEAGADLQVHTIQFQEKEKLSFGRDPGNDVVLNTPTVSRYHAQVERVGRRYFVSDLRSANGTFVNNERIDEKVALKSQDTIRIGPYRFVLGEDQFVRYDDTGGLRVEALGLNKWVRKNLNILADISLVFHPREFIVVVGQSGGGKSTLVDAIAGYRPATHGKVIVNGIDVYRNFDAIRNEIGYVPQRDIIHMELTVYQALDFAAQLRMPRDTSKAERHKRIMEVLEDLDLAHRKDNQISSLSGGQQKRVSIGVELITRPGLFFLDEPTSGLDPGTETAFMHLCRRLADQGRTIIMVTHATKNVMLADKVVFLARGGYLAWFGPPDEALAYFDQYRSERERRTRPMEFDQIYAILDDSSRGSAKDWAERFKAHPAYQQYIVEPLKEHPESLPLAGAVREAQKPAARRARSRARISSLRQFMVLSARNVKILTRDRSSMILMVLIAPAVGALSLLIAPLMGREPFDYYKGEADNGIITLFLLTLYCLLVGGLSQMREFVKESDIYRRERLVNLRILPYVTSKIWVAVVLASFHALSYTVLHFIAFKIAISPLDLFLVFVTLFLAVVAGMVGGLLASAISPAASSAPMIMILFIIPQVVLSGALAPVPTDVSQIASIRWALEGVVGVIGVGSDVARDPCWKLDKKLRDVMTLDQKQQMGCNCMGLALFKPGSCNFPGIGKDYDPAIDQLPPTEPPKLGPEPPRPTFPPQPEKPADPTNQVAMVEFLNALDSYMKDVEIVQAQYESQIELYKAQADEYTAKMAKYQEDKVTYDLKRNGAVKSAEGLIDGVSEKFGWTWINKKDPAIFWPWLFRAWGMQVLLTAIYFVIILIFIKRKDVK